MLTNNENKAKTEILVVETKKTKNTKIYDDKTNGRDVNHAWRDSVSSRR